MKGDKYIPKIQFNPTKKPTKEEILTQLENYFLKEVDKFFQHLKDN